MYALFVNVDDLVKKHTDKKIHQIRRRTTFYRDYWHEEEEGLGEQQLLQAGLSPDRRIYLHQVSLNAQYNSYTGLYFIPEQTWLTSAAGE